MATPVSEKADLQKQMEDLIRDALQHPERQQAQQVRAEALSNIYIAKYGQADFDAFRQAAAKKLFSGELGDFSMSYQGGLDGRGVTKVNDVVVSKPKVDGGKVDWSAFGFSSQTSQVWQQAAGLAGLLAGAIFWKKHRWLGAFGGYGLGHAIPALFHKEDRVSGLCQMGTAAAAVGGALAWPKQSIAGYVLAGSAAGVGLSFVPGNHNLLAGLIAMAKKNNK